MNYKKSFGTASAALMIVIVVTLGHSGVIDRRFGAKQVQNDSEVQPAGRPGVRTHWWSGL
jgi:hypothetical protein